MKCFVIMPYGNREKDPSRKQELDALYEHFIRPAVETVMVPGSADKHVLCHRGDKEPGPGEIITHIIENLVRSELAIADLTGRNPNVFYELGVRHAVNDNTILIAEAEEDVPFDLRGQRLIFYKRDFQGGGRLRNEITKAVQEIVRSPGKIDNPVRRFLFEGGWWFSEEGAEDIANSLTGSGRSPAMSDQWVIRRLSKKAFPRWAEEYFQERLESPFNID